MPLKDKVKRYQYNKKYMAKWATEHQAEIRRYQQQYRDEHKMEKKNYNKAHKQKFARITSLKRSDLKLKAVMHYGNGKCACVKCGFTDIRALSLDHINGGGTNHRKGIGGVEFYKWLFRNNYPPGLQTLCMNCQWIKRAEKREYFKGKDCETTNVILKDEKQLPLPITITVSVGGLYEL